MMAIDDVEDGQYVYANKLLTELKSQIKGELSNVEGAIFFDSGALKGPAASEKNRLFNEASDDFYDWIDKFKEEKNKAPSKTEQREYFNDNIRKTSLDKAKSWKPKNSYESGVSPVPPVKNEEKKTESDNQTDTRAEDQNSDLQGPVSSNPVMDTVNQVVNALTGTGTAAAGTLDGRSVLEDIDITKPIAQPNLQRLAIEGGFTPEQARIMAAIAMAESGGVARALNDVGDDNSFGLWQINMIDVPGFKLGEERRAKLNLKTNDELYNPAVNVRAAKMIFDEQGFEAWGAYTNGSYQDFLPNTN